MTLRYRIYFMKRALEKIPYLAGKIEPLLFFLEAHVRRRVVNAFLKGHFSSAPLVQAWLFLPLTLTWKS
jgi:hypothetical protein